MATVVDRGAGRPVGRARSEAARLSHHPITLAELITAIQDVVGPQDDGLVVVIVRHLLKSGLLTGRRGGTLFGPPQPEEKVLSHIVKEEVRQPGEVTRR
jgi:hypothetical protein